jgi:thiol:disulfide interchange protein DsbG
MAKIKPFIFVLSSILLLGPVACSQAGNMPAPIKAIEAHGVEIVGQFDAPAGLTGYAGIAGQRPVTIYLTQDKKYALIGYLIDAQGNNVGQQALRRLAGKPMSGRIWSQLESSAWVRDGESDARKIVYIFSDPNCPYCHQFWQRARPWVESGKVQLRHIIVGIIGENSPNKAATIFTAPSPEAALAKNERTFASGGIEPAAVVPAAVREKLAANRKLMLKLGFRGTPGIVFRDKEGMVQRRTGLPPGADLPTILGPR